MLDEHSNFPQATDVSLVTKFNDAFRKKKAIFIPSKGSASMTFSIQHYAGKASILLTIDRGYNVTLLLKNDFL